MATECGEDDLALSCLLAALGLANRSGDGVSRLRCREDPLATGKGQRAGKALRLRNRLGFGQTEFVDVRHQWRHAVIAQTTGVDRGWDEVVAKRVHLHQRRHTSGVAEVVPILALGQARTRRRLDAPNGRVHPAGHLLAQERERQSAEVRAATGATNQQVGSLADHRQLQQRLFADHGLVEQHVVQHAAECVSSLRIRDGRAYGLGDRDAKTSRMIRILDEQRAAVVGDVAGTRVHGRPVHLHHDPAIRLRNVRGGNLPDLAFDPVLRCRECQRCSPLTGTGLGRQLRDALLMVVVRLRHRGVGLVRAGWADAFVLVVDPRRSIERLLQPMSAEQRRWSPQPVDIEHAAGDVDVAVLCHLLHDQCHREQRRQIVGPDRLHRSWMQRRRRR